MNILPGVKHWHGAAEDEWFSHLAVEVLGKDLKNEWLEAVSQEHYRHIQDINLCMLSGKSSE